MVTIQDPISGEPKQQLVQTVTDPQTGQTLQLPVVSNVTSEDLTDGTDSATTLKITFAHYFV